MIYQVAEFVLMLIMTSIKFKAISGNPSTLAVQLRHTPLAYWESLESLSPGGSAHLRD